MTLPFRLPSLGPWLLATLSAVAPAAANEVCFVVDPPDARGPLYLAGPFSRWQPDDPEWRLAPTDDGRWTLTVERDRLGAAPIACKLTRGSWGTVEVGPDLADRPNRVLEQETLASAVVWSVAGWADDRVRTPPPARTRTVVGYLEVHELESEQLGQTRTLRVWLPPGYHEPENALRRYPVLYLNDGQNLFDQATAALGMEWRVDETVTALVQAGTIPPLLVVGIDNEGATREADYNPPFTSARGTPNRGDRYLDFVTCTVMPWIGERYRVATGPEHTGFGGSSYGGNLALYAGLRHPDLFGALLVESPAAWTFDGALLERCARLERWPARVYVAIGTRESEDARALAGYRRTAEVLRAGLDAAGMFPERALVVVDQGARHDETAWARRLSRALTFLFGE